MESDTAYPNKDELAGRGARQPDYALENSALVRLAKAQTGPRANLLQEIAATAQSICGAGSAGISLVEGAGDSRHFRWLAVAGLCADLQGKATA